MFACGPFKVEKCTRDPRCINFICVYVRDPKFPTKAVKQVERYSPNPTK